MCKSELPSQINVLQLAQQGIVLSGKLSLAAMSRLIPSLLDTDSEVDIDLYFTIDAEGITKDNRPHQSTVDAIMSALSAATAIYN